MQLRKISKERKRYRRAGRCGLNQTAALEMWHGGLTQELGGRDLPFYKHMRMNEPRRNARSRRAGG